MTTIGNFTRDGETYTGLISTLSLQTSAVFKPATKPTENAPDYRVFTHGGAEIGAAWKKTSEANKPYLSVKLDDPSFAQPIQGRLLGVDADTQPLVWNR